MGSFKSDWVIRKALDHLELCTKCMVEDDKKTLNEA